MELIPTTLPGVLLIQPKIHRDERGFFIETFHAPRYRDAGVDAHFIQDNQSSSLKNTLRGLHAQLKRPQAKLVRCIEGEIFDVAVDVRRGSPSFGKWFGAKLNAENCRQMYVPTGFVHGFAVLSERAQVEYKCSDIYVPEDQMTVLWNDPAIGVNWGIQDPILSPKDKTAKPLSELMDLLPQHLMLSPADFEQLKSCGISPTEAERQLALFKKPPLPANLDRACTVGDGITRLAPEEETRLEAKGAAALAEGRVTKFVPASGAATRMFQALQAEPKGKAATEALARWNDFAFGVEFKDGDKIAALLAKYGNAPKALIPFHWHGDHSHTAFEDHLREAQFLGLKIVHLTISPEHREGFLKQLAAMPMKLEVSFSEQKPSTDTLAGAADGGPFRDAQGKLVFRPGGHGALLENLNDLKADLVLIKNIDNISHSRLWENQLRWKKILLGALLENADPARPTRVCGVVKNTGEPGGGPFWVRHENGTMDVQIVESAQMNLKDASQRKIFESATHFNPVDLACSVKGFDLRQFRDDSAVFISQKSKDGKPLQALELPGLWNGAMAGWKTVFVEVPLETFNPVKTVNDLLKPAHQAA